MEQPAIPRQEKPLTFPVIDFSPWTSGISSAQRSEVARELVGACRKTGLVYISNHGVTPALVEEAFAWAKKFFDLPIADKMQVRHPKDSAIFRGYNPVGAQQVPLTLQVHGGDPDIKGMSPDFNVSPKIC